VRERGRFPVGSVESRLGAFGFGWKDTTAVQAYPVHDFHPVLSDELVRRGATRSGLTLHFARPPVVDLALRAGWVPVPLGLREARPLTGGLPRSSAPAAAPPADGPEVSRVRGVSHSYRELPAVRGVSLSLRGGEVSVLMGRNGCGKTTLLRLIAGFDQPTEGEILLSGVCVNARRKKSRTQRVPPRNSVCSKSTVLQVQVCGT